MHIPEQHERAMTELLEEYAGLDSYGEHGSETPRRFLKALDEMTGCRHNDEAHLKDCIKWKTFPATSDEMVTQLNVSFTSLCNHHLVPFIGVAHVSYVPNGQLVGLSKLARVVGHFARRLQVQEEMTGNIADFLEHKLNARGVAVWIQAQHMCMTVRGVRAHGTTTVTSKMLGVFADHTRTAKAEFLQIVSQAG